MRADRLEFDAMEFLTAAAGLFIAMTSDKPTWCWPSVRVSAEQYIGSGPSSISAVHAIGCRARDSSDDHTRKGTENKVYAFDIVFLARVKVSPRKSHIAHNSHRLLSIGYL